MRSTITGLPHPCSVKNSGFAVRKDADGPRRKIIVHPIKSYFKKILSIIVGKKCSTISRVRPENMGLA